MKTQILTVVLLFFCSLLYAQKKNVWSDKDCRMIYQYQDTRNSAELVKYFKHKNVKYRKLAVMAFASVQDTSVAPLLIEMLKLKKFKVKKEAAYSLGQLRKQWLFADLVKVYDNEKKAAVKAELLEAIGKCADGKAVFFFESVKLKHSNVWETGFARGVYAAARRGYKSDSVLHRLKNIAFGSKDTFIRYIYLNLSKKKGNFTKPINSKAELTLYDALDTINRIENPFNKVKFLEDYRLTQESLLTIAFSNEHHFLTSYCMEQYFKEKVKNTAIINQCLLSRNIAFIGMAAEKIRTDSLWLDLAEEKIAFLKGIMNGLPMPSNFEAFVELKRTICFLQHTSYNYTSPGFNHPIEWPYIETLNTVERVKIRTTKGSMVMTCLVNDVPASAANFLRLVDSGYYNEKYFHRVVPDFVVQGGCLRGDGWGTLNWTQRSEFNSNYTYKRGSVGLASAGKDSEGVQFFITHGFTPNLDGRYTIFGEITEGLDIIDLLQIGDMIISIQRIK